MPMDKVVSTPQECMKEPGSACRCEGRFPVSPQHNHSTAQHVTTFKPDNRKLGFRIQWSSSDRRGKIELRR
jgi:hypothetical protein